MKKFMLFGLLTLISITSHSQEMVKVISTVISSDCRVVLERRPLNSNNVTAVQYVDGYYYNCNLLLDIGGEEYVYTYGFENRVLEGETLELELDLENYAHIPHH